METFCDRKYLVIGNDLKETFDKLNFLLKVTSSFVARNVLWWNCTAKKRFVAGNILMKYRLH